MRVCVPIDCVLIELMWIYLSKVNQISEFRETRSHILDNIPIVISYDKWTHDQACDKTGQKKMGVQ